jgi:chemotaxis protein MotB
MFIMRYLLPVLFGALFITSCVPAKKYQELLAEKERCANDLASFKQRALDCEGSMKDLTSRAEMAEEKLAALKQEQATLKNDYGKLNAKYEKLVSINNSLETNYDKLRLSGAKETAILNAELEAKQRELDERKDQLDKLENALNQREQKIADQEKRLAELNEKIKAQEEATRLLKERVRNALKNFESKGLSVEERDGKIYVSLEAKLLFKSGSTVVESEGQEAIVELARVLQDERDLEIIVEGHTDTDAMRSSSHPANNWELSVLRATSVISIMLDNSEMDPVQIMAAGRSEFHPVDPNDKAKNRRIEVIISPDLDELYKLVSE